MSRTPSQRYIQSMLDKAPIRTLDQVTGWPVMSLCALCGQLTFGAEDLCLFHVFRRANDDWATRNRLMCDFLHRGIVPPTPPEPAAGFEALLEALDEAVIA